MSRFSRILHHPSELDAFAHLPLLRTSEPMTVRLGGTMTGCAERARWERTLNRYYSSCGCEAGTMGLLIALLTSAAGAGPVMGHAVLLAVTGAILGKAAGLMYAHAKLRSTIRLLQRHWSDLATE